MDDGPALPPKRESLWRGRRGVALIMLVLIGIFYLIREHSDHAVQALPYLILLLCPLLHLFGHKHGGHDGDR